MPYVENGIMILFYGQMEATGGFFSNDMMF